MSKFSLRELAKELGVGPTTIHAHFRGGVNEISKAVAAAALSGLAPPFKPKQEPDDYLRGLFFSILKTLHGRPTVATLVVLQLSPNPVLDPLLAERRHCQSKFLYCLVAHQGGLELPCFCSRITHALDRIRRRKSPILICLDSAILLIATRI